MAALVWASSVGLEVQASQHATRQSFDARRVVLGDGRHLYLDCSGHGTPTVLLEGGFGATSRAWLKVQPVVSRFTRVCSYDRAGSGVSDAGPLPRDGRAIASDLDQALRRTGIRGPLVMVGHSSGALYVRLFADRRPKDVVGMVLVDPSIEHQDKRFAEQFGPGAGSPAPLRNKWVSCLAAAENGSLPSRDPALQKCTGKTPDIVQPGALRPENWRNQISELDTLWGVTSDQIDAGRHSYGDMPLIVLTADGTFAKAPSALQPAINALWWKLHAEIAARSSRGFVRLVTGSSHLMMLDRPDAICLAIHDVLKLAKAHEPRSPP